MSTDRRPLASMVALAIVAGLGFGGAASDPDGLWLSFSWPAAVAAVVVCAAVPGSAALAPLRGLWVALIVVLFGGFFVAPRALSGPPLLALVAAGIALVASQVSSTWFSRAFVPVCAVVYLCAAHQAQARLGPRGDEPHYLMVTESLIVDHDLAVDQDYAEERYRRYHPEPLTPHYLVRGRNDTIYSLHAIGLSLLLVPAYLVAGYAGASFFMVLLGVALMVEIRRLLRLVADAPVADGIAWVVALSPPLISFSGLVFTEVPAALLIAFVLRLVAGSGAVLGATLWAGVAALGFLPWLHVRYALPAALLGAALGARRPHRITIGATLTAGALSVAALAVYHQWLYGFWNPALVFGRRPRFVWRTMLEGVPGLLLDQEFGLLLYAPVFALVPFGVAALWKQNRLLAATAIALVTATLAVAGAWNMWRGGFNPPARFLVPIVPALALGLAGAVQVRWNAPRALLVGWGLWIGLSGTLRPELIHRDREGGAPFFREFSGGTEWTRLLPRFVLLNDDRFRLAGVWFVALVGAAAWRRRNTGPMAFGGAIAGIAVAVSAASLAASPMSGSDGRDAVRVVGRRGVRIGPKPAASADAVGIWTPADLRASPVYEPHRAAAGWVIGDRLPLRPGDYSLSVEVEELGLIEKVDTPRRGRAIIVTSRSGCGVTSSRLRSAGGVLTASFTVSDSCRPVSLSFVSGEPLLLKRFILSRLNRPPGSAL